MREIFWKAIPKSQLASSFWSEHAKTNHELGCEQLIEEHFEAKKVQKVKKKKKKVESLLDGKRAQNVGIFMSSFKLSPDELDAALSVLPGGVGALSPDQVLSVRKLAPTTEEEESYAK